MDSSDKRTTREGAVRGIYHGANGIKGHADFVVDEVRKGGAVVTNATAAADDFNFRPIEESTVQRIVVQTNGNDIHKQDTSNLYSDNVQLIAKDGKVYYLPSIN